VSVIGTGGIARHHLRGILADKRRTRLAGFVEVSEKQKEATRALLDEHKTTCPTFYETIRDLVKAEGAPDVGFVCTPHKYHYANTADCLRTGMDVLLEKPMVMNAAEARGLIRLRDKTRRLLVVAFPGSLSPAVRTAREWIARGKIGPLSAVTAYVHQRWMQGTTGTWRQDPDISGGGFLFDTGSHMVNTVVDLLGEDVAEVSARFDNCGTPVEIRAVVTGLTRSGVMFSLTAAGDSVTCTSDVVAIGRDGVLQTGIWGGALNLRTQECRDFKPIPTPPSKGVWDQFVRVRQGRMENPCPPEVGLRFAKLMDLIRESARTGQTARARR
jgi:predicted dehydrogenase